MRNRLIQKFESLAPLSEADKRLLEDATGNVREIEAKADLIKEGEAPDDVHLILDGFACRYKLTDEGTRQIMAYLVPGDFCDLHGFILK
jgi:CRP-like cAMP-binding protein